MPQVSAGDLLAKNSWKFEKSGPGTESPVRPRISHMSHFCALLGPNPAVLAALSRRFSANRRAPEIRRKIQKPLELTKIHRCYTCDASVRHFALEIGHFAVEIARFQGRNRRPDRQRGEKRRHRKGLRTPHTLAHDATEVTHGVASRIPMPVGNSLRRLKNSPEVRPDDAGGRLREPGAWNFLGDRRREQEIREFPPAAPASRDWPTFSIAPENIGRPGKLPRTGLPLHQHRISTELDLRKFQAA